LYGGFALWANWIFFQNASQDPSLSTSSFIAIYGLCTLSCLCLLIILITLSRILRHISGQHSIPTEHNALIQPQALKKTATSNVPFSKTPTPTTSQLPDSHPHAMVSINLFVPNCEKALSFYEQAFGAISVHTHFSVPEGEKIARFKIGNDLFALADENLAQNTKSALTLGGAPVCLQLFVEDVRETVERALVAGADVRPPSTLARPVIMMSDHTELGHLIDPFGFTWAISQEDYRTVNIRNKETSYIARHMKYDNKSGGEPPAHRQKGA